MSNHLPRAPDLTNVHLDPDTCDVMEEPLHRRNAVEPLKQSITHLGQLHPALVMEHAESGRRLVVAGRRRWLACKQLGIPLTANVWTCHDEDINLKLFAKALRIAENIERVDASAAHIMQQLLALVSARVPVPTSVFGRYLSKRPRLLSAFFVGRSHFRSIVLYDLCAALFQSDAIAANDSGA